MSHYQVVERGDLVMNQLGKPHGSLGISPFRGIISPAYFVAEIGPTAAPRFVHHLLRTRLYISEYERRGKYMPPSQFDISWEQFRSIPVLLPALDLQRAIADFLDTETARIDALITKKRRMIDVLTERTESLTAAVLDRLVERYGEVPLKACAELRVSNIDKKSYEGQLQVRLCNYTDVYHNRKITARLDYMEATADRTQATRLGLRRGDVLITKDSETPDDIAVPALVVEDLPGVVLGYHLALLRPFGVDGAFLYWTLRSRRCRDAFSLAASGVTRFGLRQDAVGRVPVPCADQEAQDQAVREIERQVGQAEAACAGLSQQVALLAERRQALITAAVTGELAVPGVAA